MKKLVSTLLLTSLIGLPAHAAYNDVSQDHQYIESITYIELEGASDDASDFRPDDIINRAESFKLLFEVLHIETNEPIGGLFEDTPVDAWFTPYAELALEYDLINDRTPEFKADKQMRRSDALYLIMQSYGLTAPVVNLTDRPELFNDIPTNSSLYPWIYHLVQLDIIDADPNSSFKAYVPITRAEFTNWLYELDKWMQIFELDQYAIDNPDFYKSDIMASIWDSITNDYYLDDYNQIDQDALFQAAIKGMLESLNDPFSQYFSSEEANSFTESLSGVFEGIGAILDQNDNGEVKVEGLLENAPAAAAGLQTNDIIHSVDGVDVSKMELEDVLKRIKGPAGTYVELGIIRGDSNLIIEIKRAQIEIILQSGEVIWNDVWYIDIDTFSSDLPQKLMEVMYELEEQVESPEAIIIDLRGNVGGSLQSGTFLTGLFLPQFTPLVQLNYGEGYSTMISNGDIGPYKEFPLYILMDSNSASASEIAAKTLQENGATIVGQQSFGKGTAQNYKTFWDGSAIKLTIAEWLSGAGESIQNVGVTPDLVLADDADEEAWLEAVKQEL